MLSGTIGKLRAEVKAPLQYFFPIGDQELALRGDGEQRLRLTTQGQIRCQACQRLTRKSYNQGYCYPCFTRLAACDMCILKPELCHHAAGSCREPAWGEAHCMVPHIVYLANSSGLKVGITRATQVPTRWIDQGASAALPLFRVGSRYHSGLIEVALARHVADKTQWQALLRGDPAELDLVAEAERLLALCAQELAEIEQRFPRDRQRLLPEVHRFQYPVLRYPDKIKALTLAPDQAIEGRLLGIKGQYLILEEGVLNVRKHTSYVVTLEQL